MDSAVGSPVGSGHSENKPHVRSENETRTDTAVDTVGSESSLAGPEMDVDLGRVVGAWPSLPSALKAAILAIVATVDETVSVDDQIHSQHRGEVLR